MKLRSVILSLLAAGAVLSAGAQSKPQVRKLAPLDMKRVAEIEQMLEDTPKGFGVPYSDHKEWRRLRATGRFEKVIKDADKLLETGFTPWDEEVFMGVFTKNDSQSGKDMVNKRLAELPKLVIAECLTDANKYTPMIIDFLNDMADQKTWFNPSDYRRANGQNTGFVELATAMQSVLLANTLYLLDDKIDQKTRQRIIDNLYLRTWNPAMSMFDKSVKNDNPSGRTPVGAMTGTNNWNPVCIEGVVASALTLIPDKKERAKYAYMAEHYVHNFVIGFLDDGYCTEGLGYYSYGMQHYIPLREKLWQATGGKLDIFDKEHNPNLLNIGTFPVKCEIMNNIFPSIADCGSGAKPNSAVTYYMSKVLGLGLPIEQNEYIGNPANVSFGLMMYFPNSLDNVKHEKGNKFELDPLRSAFPDAGVYIMRPGNSQFKMGVAAKGGNNAEHHNHNDLGSYSILVNKQMMVEDPGLAPYTFLTFSDKRYTIQTLASYGHATPLVAGVQQHPGRDAKAVVTDTQLTPKRDMMTMDLSSAYKVPELTKLLRTFTYDRGKATTFSVQDVFEFNTPQAFETAIITRAEWKQIAPDKILLTRKGETLLATIESTAPFTIKDEVNDKDNKKKPWTRLAITLKEPQKSGKITVTYTKNGK